MALDVFISYSSKDKAVADAACAMLESRLIRCWIAPRDVLPGMTWGASIVDGIKQCRVMVLVFSSYANDSQQVMREVERAIHHGIPILPLRIQEANPSGDMEYFLSAMHWLDALTPPLEKHLLILVETVARLLSKGDLGSPTDVVSDNGDTTKIVDISVAQQRNGCDATDRPLDPATEFATSFPQPVSQPVRTTVPQATIAPRSKHRYWTIGAATVAVLLVGWILVVAIRSGISPIRSNTETDRLGHRLDDPRLLEAEPIADYQFYTSERTEPLTPNDGDDARYRFEDGLYFIESKPTKWGAATCPGKDMMELMCVVRGHVQDSQSEWGVEWRGIQIKVADGKCLIIRRPKQFDSEVLAQLDDELWPVWSIEDLKVTTFLEMRICVRKNSFAVVINGKSIGHEVKYTDQSQQPSKLVLVAGSMTTYTRAEFSHFRVESLDPR